MAGAVAQGVSQCAQVRKDYVARHGSCRFSCVNSVMARDRYPVRVDPVEFERECEIWDWARAAGVSAQDLRRALIDLLATQELA